jgi:hypothetical protein
MISGHSRLNNGKRSMREHCSILTVIALFACGVEASDALWGARHLARTTSFEMDPEAAARVDRELAELNHVTEKWLAELRSD